MKTKLKSLAIELTNNCNFKCSFCWANKSPRPKGFMSKELFDKIITEAQKLGVTNICLNFAGESTIHPEFEWFCNRVKGISKSINIITNGSNLIKVGKTLIDNNINMTISINGMGNNYEKFCGYPYQNTKNNVSYLLNLRKSKVPTVKIYHHIWQGETQEDIDKYIIEWSNKADGLYFTPSIDNMEWKHGVESFTFVKQRLCRFPFYYMAILWDGSISPCCRDIGAELAFGNVNKNTMAEIFSGDVYNKFREMSNAHKFEDDMLCSRCKLWEYIPTTIKI